MSKFWNGVGGFFQDLGTGVTTTVQGLGDTLTSRAAYTRASAANMAAETQARREAEAMRQEAQARQQRNILFIAALAIIVPLLGVLIVRSSKK